MSLNPVFSIGVLRDSQTLLKMLLTRSGNSNLSSYLEIGKFDFSPTKLIFEICQACRLVVVEENLQLNLTTDGKKIAVLEDDDEALRQQVVSYIESCRPDWSYVLPHGKTALKSIPPDAYQCLEESGFLETTREGVQNWQRLIQACQIKTQSPKDEIGLEGEYLSHQYEKLRTGVVPRWISQETDLAGYDILSQVSKKDRTRQRVEVKASVKSINNASIFVSRNEFAVSIQKLPYVFHFWLLNTCTLYIVNPRLLKKHTPSNNGDGSWTSVEIPISSFVGRRLKDVVKIDFDEEFRKKNSLYDVL